MRPSSIELSAEIFVAALRSVDPYTLVISYADRIRNTFRTGRYKKLGIIGFGKASCPMAKGIEFVLADEIVGGILITKYEHCIVPNIPEKISVFEAAHPLPDENGIKGASQIIRLLEEADAETLIVCLISGGGSALLVSPAEGLNLTEKQLVTDLLLRAGADINELNTVRKHLSRVKGGRLAEIAYPAKVVSLILSDVLGDSLDVIASGPTAPDNSTFSEALKVLEKYELKDRVPSAVLDFLLKGETGLVRETPKEGNQIFELVENVIIGSNQAALQAARTKAESLGCRTEILSSEITGDAGIAAKKLAAEALKRRETKNFQEPLCLISGGETTVNVKGTGKGGRNMELALSFALEIDGIIGITLLSAGTDGTDGPTDAAGAFVDGLTFERANSLELNPRLYLENNDSYNFFKQAGGLYVTGPTGTNVMDIQVIIID
jgi:glycerate 2-kinase